MEGNHNPPQDEHSADRVAEEALAYHSAEPDADSWQDEPAIVLDRITFNPGQMTGRPCIRGLRITVGTIIGLFAAGATRAEVLEAYPFLDGEDIRQALLYAASRCSNERIVVAHE